MLDGRLERDVLAGLESQARTRSLGCRGGCLACEWPRLWSIFLGSAEASRSMGGNFDRLLRDRGGVLKFTIMCCKGCDSDMFTFTFTFTLMVDA